MGTRGGSWWFQAHFFGEQQCATLDSYEGWMEVCPCGRTVSSWSSRSPYQGCRTPIPYRCQALDQAPHGPVYPCDTAFPLVVVCSAWRFLWI
ncbi:hypothetical protein ACQJBY_017138 [Aegilops geniculata]